MTPPPPLETIEIETGAGPGASVIWLHGLGANGRDFVPIVSELGLPESPAIRFVFPHAPLRAVTVNMGAIMRAWYDLELERGDLRADEADIRESQGLIEGLIERERERGISATAIVLAGFSQGGAMALHTGLRYPARLAGILALSCSLPLAGTLDAETSPANRDVPIFMGHGVDDPLIRIGRARRSHARLVELGYRVTWREYPMPHSLCDAEVGDIGVWLGQTLAVRSDQVRPVRGPRSLP
jgi:phospholipase/carboxylesterase